MASRSMTARERRLPRVVNDTISAHPSGPKPWATTRCATSVA
jgi:hypothetical protein